MPCRAGRDRSYGIPEAGTLALSDLSGRVVLRQPLTETRSTVDCSKLVEGVYFWRVELDYTSVSGKLIIRGER
jgi:hypothetical protein